MKHVIVVETVDVEDGGQPIPEDLQKVLLRAVEIGVEEGLGNTHNPCFVRGKFNVLSVTAAIHQMYNVDGVYD